ncbi:hypothetical protein [Maritalea myrionectae]|uniref:Uncharacterized protein n=1 Tax=Maritalea myrionectae TaxID=454601 RepID=A0A2R4MCU8_9HYPH|nr:hypothetical protein [Maritalea myrionectae]AVX03764.1 hypothetical protein MXMO3_01233 [Maritalea myrionectae]
MKTLTAATVAFLLVSAGFALDIQVTSQAEPSFDTAINTPILD